MVASSTTRPTGRRVMPPRGPDARARLRHPRRVPGLDLPHAADPRPGRARHRLQDRRRGDLPAQPRARPARPRRPRPPTRPVRRRALTFVFVGGGYAGIEAMAELEDMARDACKLLPRHRAGRHALGAGRGDRPDPARGRRRRWASTPSSSCPSAASRSRSNTRLESCVDGHVVLSDGDEFDAETLVWTAGVQGQPGARTPPTCRSTSKGRLTCTRVPAGRRRRGRLGGR